MVLPGHLSGGYLIAKILLSSLQPNLDSSEINILLLVGTLAGELPDIDLGIHFLEKHLLKKDEVENHRSYITHAPLFWIGLSVIIFLCGLLFHSLFIEYLSLMIGFGTLSHFVFDSIEYGVKWLRPFSQRRFSLRVDKVNSEEVKQVEQPKGFFQAHWDFVKGEYLKSWTIWIEISVTLIALGVLVRS